MRGVQGECFPGALPLQQLPWPCWPMRSHLCALSSDRPRRPGGQTVRLLDGRQLRQNIAYTAQSSPPLAETGGGSGEGHPPRHPLILYISGSAGCWSAWLHRGRFPSRWIGPWIWPDGLCPPAEHLGVQGNVDPGLVVWQPRGDPGPVVTRCSGQGQRRAQSSNLASGILPGHPEEKPRCSFEAGAKR